MKSKFVILGLGSRSTTYYISNLNEIYNAKVGGYSTCPFTLLNTDFNSINMLLPNTSTELDVVVLEHIKQIDKLDAAYLLVPNITLHETIDGLNIAKNILHPVHLSIKKIKEKNKQKVVLFGSLFSMKSGYISDQFKTNDIDVFLPDENDMVFIDQVRKHVYNQTETLEVIEKYQEILDKYSKDNLVVISCTELSIINPKENKMVLDMAELQMMEAVNKTLIND